MKVHSILILLAAACFAQEKEAPPPLATPKPFALPVYQTFSLKNGMKVTLAQYGTTPVVSVKADLLASLALFDDNPALINSLEDNLRKVTPELVLSTAKEYLRPTNRTILVLEAGAQPKAPQAPTGGAK